MTWTYSQDPAHSDRDAVRFLIGDTDRDDQLLSDEEIAWLLTQSANVYFAAAMAAETVVSKYGSAMQRTVGSLSINEGEIRQSYGDIAKRLRRMAVKKGGVTVILTNEDTEQYVEKGMHDNSIDTNELTSDS